MKTKFFALALFVTLSFSSVGCGPPIGYGDPGTRMVRGAMGGAIAGGILGKGRGAAAGAIIGGMLGAATAPAPAYYPRPVPSAYYGPGYHY